SLKLADAPENPKILTMVATARQCSLSELVAEARQIAPKSSKSLEWVANLRQYSLSEHFKLQKLNSLAHKT
ncbi:hypothetical protein A2U01_0106295, partial [Trifolium medium]|nr:hypothetical protein [Trifolium medium]